MCGFTFGQEKTLQKADEKFGNFAYVDAREIYLDVAKSGYESEDLYKKLGNSYYFNNELPNALEWYEALYKYQKKLDKDYLFRYAMALKSVERYTEADSILKINWPIKNSTDSYLDKIKQNENKFTIKKASVNDGSSNFAPAFYNSKIVFASDRTNEKSDEKIHKWNNKPFSNLYSVGLKRDNELDTKVETFSGTINSPYHESSAVFTKDGKTMYFTRNNFNNNEYKESTTGVNMIKVYKSIKKGENWSAPEELPFNSDNYSVAHPALNKTEDKLYFSSDMEGSLGNSDLFYVEINEDGSYGTPTNLGAKINTTARETFPFIDDENKLFFASDGHLGLGGLDVFVTEIENENFNNEIINLSRPVNSPQDDFAFIIDTDQTGFYSSNRGEKNGNDNIYSFIANEKITTGCKELIAGFVMDDFTGKPIKDISVELYNNDLKLLNSTTTNKEGKYSFEVACNTQNVVRVAINGFRTSEKTFAANGNKDSENKLNIALKEGSDLGKTKIAFGDDLGKTLLIEPIFFDFDKYEINSFAEVELQKIVAVMKKIPALNIEIRSHTDSQGDSNYNMNLSKQRANQTASYITKNGINKNRINANGFGDTQLINKCEKGVACSNAQHQQNRRSEFIILNPEDKKEIRSVAITPINKTSVKKETNKITNTNSAQAQYNFSSDELVYTVQISASSNYDSSLFSDVPNVFGHKYADGLVRYFSGTFTSYEAATAHKEALLKAGKTPGAFVTGLKGEKRVNN